MPTQDQQGYHFKLSEARSLTSAVSAIHKHTHTLLRGKLLLYASNITTTTDNHAHKYQYRQNSAKMQLFPKHWELLVPLQLLPEALHGQLPFCACSKHLKILYWSPPFLVLWCIRNLLHTVHVVCNFLYWIFIVLRI